MHTNISVLAILLAITIATCAVSLISANKVHAQEDFNITTTQIPGEATINVSLLTGEGNVTVIDSENATVVENVTVTPIDNDTIVIAPPTENVTTIPESNITVITPAPEEVVPCDCPTVEEGIPPVTVQPAPGQEVTIENATVIVSNETGVVVEGTGNETAAPVPEPEPTPAPVEPEPTPAPANDTGIGGGGDNGTVVIEPAPEEPAVGNDTGAGNDTGTSFFIQAIPWLNE